MDDYFKDGIRTDEHSRANMEVFVDKHPNFLPHVVPTPSVEGRYCPNPEEIEMLLKDVCEDNNFVPFPEFVVYVRFTLQNIYTHFCTVKTPERRKSFTFRNMERAFHLYDSTIMSQFGVYQSEMYGQFMYDVLNLLEYFPLMTTD